MIQLNEYIYKGSMGEKKFFKNWSEKKQNMINMIIRFSKADCILHEYFILYIWIIIWLISLSLYDFNINQTSGTQFWLKKLNLNLETVWTLFWLISVNLTLETCLCLLYAYISNTSEHIIIKL